MARDRKLLEQMARLLMQPRVSLVRIAFAGSDGFAPLMARGNYDWISPEIRHASAQGTTMAPRHLGLVLVHYNSTMLTADVMADLARRRLRPAGIEEVLILGASAKTRDLQRSFPIIALGSQWNSEGGSRVCPLLAGNPSNRQLLVTDVASQWEAPCRFSAIRPPQSPGCR